MKGVSRPLIRIFLEHMPLARRVLELGCMEGGRTFPLARRVGQVVAVDARREHLQRARYDVIPPSDVIEKLLRGFDHETASVAGPYRSRFHNGYVAWTDGRQIIRERPKTEDRRLKETGPDEPSSRLQPSAYSLVEGNGFGCTLFRTQVLREAIFTCRQLPHVDFDPAFYERLKPTGLKAKLCWEAACQHLENDTRPIMTWDHWPESWETADLAAYRAGFLSGREACQWIVDTVNGHEPAALWGLSDGDVAWWCYDALAKLPDVDRRWLDKLAGTSGLHLEDRDELWPLFDEACRNAPAWLCQFGWDIAERFTHAALVAHGVGIEREGFRCPESPEAGGWRPEGGRRPTGDCSGLQSPVSGLKKKVDCNAIYKLLDEGLWWPLLEGKRLAIVSNRADELAGCIANKAFVRESGEDVRWSVLARVVCPDKSIAKREHWPRMRDKLFAAEWDLLLCSAGSLSAILCERARQAGRKAIDIGALDRVLTAK